MPVIADVKFCLNCGLPFIKKWNKNLDPGYMDRDNCCKKCELAHYRKRLRAGRQEFGKNRYGVLS